MVKTRIIELKGLSWEADTKRILHDITWDVRQGEHWVILGLNGSGKTSLMKILNAYAAPSSGTLRVLGRTYGEHDWREMRRRIGFVSSSLADNLYAAETALETALSGLFASIGLWEDANDAQIKKALSTLHSLGAGPIANEPFSTLSQGERQRTLIARALIGAPEILILDEPCEGLDVIARESLLGSLSSIAGEENPPTLLYVTHRAEEIVPVFTHALLIKEGMIFTKGKVSEVITSGTLSRFYGRHTEVQWKKDRPWINF